MDAVAANNIIKMELHGLFPKDRLEEMKEIINYYKQYEGEELDWIKTTTDYVATEKKTNYIKKLIDEEARFMFSKPPYFNIDVEGNEEAEKKLNKYLKRTLKKNLFNNDIIKATKDFLIGKRIALKLVANKETKKIEIAFIPSLEFVFVPKLDNVKELEQIIFCYQLEDNVIRENQRFWKQKYYIKDGYCYVYEAIYDGKGNVLKIIKNNENTKLTFIPCYVIMNDALTGDTKGKSDVKPLVENQKAYNQLTSEDIDTIIKGMNRIIYMLNVDDDDIMEEDGTPKISYKAGAIWNLSKDKDADEDKAEVNTIGSDFGYDQRIENALDRILTDMYNSLSIPKLNTDDLKALTSSKAIKAIYQQFTSCIEEKMTSWIPMLEWMVEAIIEMSRIYKIGNLPNVDIEDMEITVQNQYPLPSDEYEEKDNDIKEVNTQVMSRKKYIEKWQNVPADVADEELKQIQLEKQLLEDSYSQFETNLEDDE